MIASRRTKVNHVAKGDETKSLYSSLRGVGSCNSSMLNLDEFDWMKEKKSELSSNLAIATFSATKELVKTAKKGLDDNP